MRSRGAPGTDPIISGHKSRLATRSLFGARTHHPCLSRLRGNNGDIHGSRLQPDPEPAADSTDAIPACIELRFVPNTAMADVSGYDRRRHIRPVHGTRHGSNGAQSTPTADSQRRVRFADTIQPGAWDSVAPVLVRFGSTWGEGLSFLGFHESTACAVSEALAMASGSRDEVLSKMHGSSRDFHAEGHAIVYGYLGGWLTHELVREEVRLGKCWVPYGEGPQRERSDHRL
ncbi:hypothetical protein VTK56DRAFT_7645 [Thermocarpiscus australiensis]